MVQSLVHACLHMQYVAVFSPWASRCWASVDTALALLTEQLWGLALLVPASHMVCAAPEQMASFPHVALDFWTLERLALAASHGELDTIDESLVWIP